MPKTEIFNRDYVLKRATEVFRDKGFNATSMQDLVDATDLNRSSIYNSFESKVGLFLACLKFYQDSYDKVISNALLNVDNPLEAIKTILTFHLNEIVRNKDEKGCLITNCRGEMANHDQRITNFLNTNQQNTISIFEDLIVRGQKQSLINTRRTAHEYAVYLFSSFQGFRMASILITDKNELQSIIETIIQTLI